jgi:hypothetical protein
MRTNTFKTLAILLAAAAMLVAAFAGEPTGQKTLAATIDVFVFPKEGQTSEVQSKDEAACYLWAVENTGNDPFDLMKKADTAKKKAEKEKEKVADATAGAGAAGAVRGAAVGALIGEIADDDAGEGAAYGAAIGMIGSRRRARAARRQAEMQAEKKVEKVEQVTEEQIENFKKAFSVCLEAKDYLVKY